MELEEQAEQIRGWLQDLRYPHALPDDLPTLLKGDFGASLLWLSRHAVGRRHAAHVKTQLHSLREFRPPNLSPALRAQLGLDLWSDAVSDTAELHAHNFKTVEQTHKQLKSSAAAESSLSTLLNQRLQYAIASSALSDLEAATTTQEVRIAALGARLDAWTKRYQQRLDESSAAQDVLTAARLLQEDTVPTLPLGSFASPQYLEELSTLLDKKEWTLRDTIERHQLIRPPVLDEIEQELFGMQEHCIVLSAAGPSSLAETLPPVEESSDQRERLLAALSRSRSRRAALLLETQKLRGDPSPSCPVPEADRDVVKEAKAALKLREERIAQLSGLREEVRKRIGADSQRIVPARVEAILAAVAEAAEQASAALRTTKERAMAGSACATNGPASSEPLGLLSAVHKDQKLATASRLALHNYHILDSASPLARSLSSSAVHQFGDSLAESRFLLEALKPPLGAQVAQPLQATCAELERLVRLRTNFTSGRLLPPLRGGNDDEGTTLAERWWRGEQEATKARRAAAESVRG